MKTLQRCAGRLMPVLMFLILSMVSLAESEGDLNLEPIFLQITFSDQSQAGKQRAFGSNTREMPRLSVMNGHTVSFSRSREPDYAVRTWVATVGENQEHQVLQVTPVVTGEVVSLEVIQDILQTGDRIRLSTRVTGRLGEWIPAYTGVEKSGRVFSTKKDNDVLFIRVDTAN